MTEGTAESLSVPIFDQTCCLVPAAEPPLAGPHERWCGRTGVSHPLLPDFPSSDPAWDALDGLLFFQKFD